MASSEMEAPFEKMEFTSRTERMEQFAKTLPYPVAATNLAGAYAMTALPKSGDLANAESKTLLRHGIPFRRPDANDRPAVKAAWDSVYNRETPFKLIVPQLKPQPGKTHRGARAPQANGTATVSGFNWAGAIMNSTTTTGPWASVTGQYTVPTVSTPGAGNPAVVNGGWQSASWVGIDGYTDSVSSNDVLQIGVEQDVDSKGNASYSAWFEWAVAGAQLTGGITSISQAVTFGQTTPLSPSLASVNGKLYAAWRGDGNSNMNIMVSNDGKTFQTPVFVTADTSDTSPAICETNGNLYLAWKGHGNDNLNLAQVTLDGNGHPTGLIKKQTLGDTSKSAPALTSLNGILYLAWRGEGNDHICIMGSPDGVTWTAQHVSGQNTPTSPTLGVCNNQMFVAWRGDGNENLNVAAVSLDKNKVPTAIDNVHTLGITSPQAPALAGVNGFLYLSFIGDKGDEVYVFVSEDEGNTFPVGHSSSESSPSGPAMAVLNGQMFISWRGERNDLLNVAPILSNFDTYEYVPVQANILNFPISPGDSVTASANYNGTSSGTVQLANHTTGLAFSLTLAPPPGANFNGKCIEWIMETPQFGAGSSAVFSALPSFTTLVFTGAFGCSAGSKAMGDPSQGVIKEVINAANVVKTTTTTTSDGVSIAFKSS